MKRYISTVGIGIVPSKTALDIMKTLLNILKGDEKFEIQKQLINLKILMIDINQKTLDLIDENNVLK